MYINEYEIPKEFIEKFRVTKKDKRDFKIFLSNELKLLNEFTNLSSDDIELIHNSLMNTFWIVKGINKEKYTPLKYKKSIYVSPNLIEGS